MVIGSVLIMATFREDGKCSQVVGKPEK